MDATSRRELLKHGLAAAGAGLVAVGCDRARDPYALDKPIVPGVAGQRLEEERWVTTACDQCPMACGIRVRVIEGRAVKIEGLREDPVSMGGVGPRGQAGLDVLYHPDRVRTPLKRTGPRGSGSFRAIGWDQAIAEVAAELGKLRGAGDAHRLVVVSGRERGMMNDLWQRFCRVYGTPNLLITPSLGPAGALGRAFFLATGATDLPAYDLGNTSYVLSLGAGMLEGSRLGGYATRGTAESRQARSGRRAKLLQIEPTFSLTAAAADEWIPIRPGNLAQVALALGHILVKEGLHDRAFLADHVFGFEGWSEPGGAAHAGYQQLLDRHAPETVAATSGIPVETLVRVARELAYNRPAVVLVDERSTAGPDGLEVARAALALSAVLGCVDRAGGIVFQPRAPIRDWPEAAPDAVAQAGLAQPRVDSPALTHHPLAEAIPEALATNARPPGAVLLYYTNPAFSFAQPERMRAALDRVPLVVSFSPFADESTALADYVLPDHTFLERWEDAEGAPTAGFPVFRVRRPAVKPLHDTRQTGDALIGLAKALGGPVADAFPWDDFRAAMLARATGIREAGRGTVQADDDEAFVEALLAAGFWADPEGGVEHWAKPLATPSGRFELFSQEALARYRGAAARSGQSIDAIVAAAGAASLDAACLGDPPVTPAAGDPREFPFVFLPYVSVTHVAGGPPAEQLSELGEPLTGVRWAVPLELNPSAAEAAGLREGDVVAVESPAGRLEARVHLFEGIPPDVARMAIGAGHRRGAGAAYAGANPRDILSAAVTTALGRPAVAGVRVRLRKVRT